MSSELKSLVEVMELFLRFKPKVRTLQKKQPLDQTKDRYLLC